jgi:hypothetical protein
MFTFIFRMLVCGMICLGAASQTMACDGCGSGINANYMGILPQFRQHFAGVRYSYNAVSAAHPPSLFESPGAPADQRFSKAEVWGRFYPTNRLQLFAFVPYQVNTRKEQSTLTETRGLGDITVLANYILLNTGDSGNFTARNTLSFGGGIKAPTGHFDASGNPVLQAGSGSWGAVANLIYTLRYKKSGINIEANARFNGTNSVAYRYGNAYNSGARYFYWHKRRLISFLPYAGVSIEYTEKDRSNSIVQRYTGGNGTYASAGIDVYFRRISVGISGTLPVHEQLFEGLVTTRQRISMQAIYLF